MIGDGREIESGKSLDYDLCIVGAGAAGITLARAFIGDERSVVLIESGGLDPDAKTQDLYTGFNDGIAYPMAGTRLRFFGGTTNHWTGMCRPLSDSEFAQRSWIPNSGWPIDAAALAPYYRKAQKICELGPYQYETRYWQKKGLKLLDLSNSGFGNQVYQVGPPTRFGRKYREALRKAKNVTVLLNANVTEFVPSANGKTVKRAHIKCLNGNTFSIRARTFILASGGIENARTLLASNSVISNGLGNQHDNVGRYFMDHIRAFGTAMIQARGKRIAPAYKEIIPAEKAKLTTVFRLDPQTEQQYGIGGFYSGLYRFRKSNAAYSYRSLLQAFARQEWPQDLDRHLENILADPDDAHAEHRRMQLEEQGYSELYTTIDLMEQLPDRDSRVRLSQQTDPLGVPKILMHWKFGDAEKKTLQISHKLLRQALTTRDIAKMSALGPLPGWTQRVSGSAHHMGTTRMHTDPKRGVVNANCQVFGIGNLFVAGSSVFTSAGTTNPTLTIVALALRLAEHIRASGS